MLPATPAALRIPGHPASIHRRGVGQIRRGRHAQRAAAGMVFEAFNRYAGMAVGEHLGYVSTAVWTVLIAVAMLRTALVPRWMAAIGAVLALGIAAGLAEPAGWELGDTINAL